MNGKIIVSADSTCDIGDNLKEKYNVHYYPFHISLDGKYYRDGIDIFPEDIFKKYYEKGILPKTAAIGSGEYIDYFRPFVEDGFDVIHLNLGSALSCAHQNCIIAAKELGHIYPIDSGNLSSGIGLLVLEAAQMANRGLDAQTISENIKGLTSKVHSSFVLDTLKFLKAGGRCSTLASIGANLFKIKPCIEVNNKDGSMHVGKKYRGELSRVLNSYTDDILSSYTNIKNDKIFIVNAGLHPELLRVVYNKVAALNYFKNIYMTTACCTISSHCGPNTLGIMYMLR